MNVAMRTSRLAVACSLVALATLALAGIASAEVVEKKETVKLTNVFATLQNGSHDANPQHLAACRQQVSAIGSRFLGSSVTTSYKINTQSLIMSASSSLPSPKATQPLELTVPLSPLGVEGEYAFGAFQPAVLPGTYVLFSVSKQFTSPTSSVLVLNKDKPYNCLVSSNPQAIQGALGAKLGAGQQGK